MYKFLTLSPFRLLLFSTLGLTLAISTGCPTVKPPPPPPVSECEPYTIDLPEHIPPMPVPADNPLTTCKVELGKKLFFDPGLSIDSTISCGSCHLQENNFSDPRAISLGVEGRRGFRNSMPLMNLAWDTVFFWDGRKSTLEDQLLAPIADHVEMDFTIEGVVERLRRNPEYVELFQKTFGTEPNAQGVMRAIASFERTLVSVESPYDDFLASGLDPSTLSPEAYRGFLLFNSEKGECFHCHGGELLIRRVGSPDMSRFSNNGLSRIYEDQGRFEITGDFRDIGKFKIPSLRNIAHSAPYMHDGRFNTLEEVLEHYSQGGAGHENQDPFIRAIDLDEQGKRDIIAFLKTLTDDRFLTNPEFRP